MAREIQIPATQNGFLSTYLRSINGILNLTEKEIRTLSEMLKISTKITATKEIRHSLVEALGLRTVMDVTNQVKALKDKKVIFKNKELKGYNYNPIVVPTSDEVHIRFKIA